MNQSKNTSRPVTMTTRQRERSEQIAKLRKLLKSGTTVYTVLRRVSSTGMTRLIDLYVIAEGDIVRITWSAAKVLELPYCRKREALRVTGCGMDMGWDTVYGLSQILLHDGGVLTQRWL